MMFETFKHVPKTEKCCCMFLKIIVSFLLTRPFGKDFCREFLGTVKLKCRYVKGVPFFYAWVMEGLPVFCQKFYTRVTTGLGKLRKYAANNENKKTTFDISIF